MSALEWWSQEPHQKRWPRLSLLAFEVLSIPAMSDKPERIFSGGRRTVTWERMHMNAETLEMTECTKDWHRSGILKDVP